jgi:archaeosine-15-forming tRNA-guanine transglycosylase
MLFRLVRKRPTEEGFERLTRAQRRPQIDFVIAEQASAQATRGRQTHAQYVCDIGVITPIFPFAPVH